MDLAGVGEDAVEGLDETPLAGLLGGTQQQRIDLVDRTEQGAVGAAPVGLVRVPMPLVAIGQQILPMEGDSRSQQRPRA